MREHPAALLDVVDGIYQAALDPAGWDDALRRVAPLIDGVAVGMHIERSGRAVTQRWVDLDPKFSEAYRAHYWREDPWALSSRRLRERAVRHGEALVARRELLKTAFYNDLCKPYGVDDLLVAVVSRTPGQLAMLAVTGGAGRNFSAADAATTALLVPHVARALQIGERLRTFPFDSPDIEPSLEDRLRLAFGLTRAEARVAVCVGEGRSPKEAAAILGSSWNTVRSQLRQIFEKTHTSGQPELARLVLHFELGGSVPAPRARDHG